MSDPHVRRCLGVVRRAAPVAAVLAGAGALLSACGGDNNRQNSLHPKGHEAQDIQHLFVPIFWVAAAIGIAVLTATVVFALRFRHRPGQPDEPRQIHGSTPLEIGWTIVPALILAVVAVPTVSTIFKLAEAPAKAARLDVSVTGKQWWWQFEYPKQRLVSKPVVTSTELHIPAGVPVYLSETSDNVIHSFWVPELNGKRDVVPARTNHLTIQADKPGTYLGQCAEYCGLGHADMRFRVIVQTRADWEAWLRDQQGGPAQPYSGPIADLTGTKYQCVNCHVFDDSTKATYGPNLTHLATRHVFAGGVYELNRDNLVRWVMDAPSRIPMQSKDCRKPAGPKVTCVGMPSFTRNTPPGLPVMTRQDADTIVSYLLGER